MTYFPTDVDIPDRWQVGDDIIHRYKVEDVITSGGMGIIYRVRARSWDVDLAVKSPRMQYFRNQEDRENFVSEAERWSNLGLHPNIVSCYYVQVLGGIPRIFAEYVSGGSLEKWTQQRKLYSGGPEQGLQRILDIGIQVAWGLAHAHANEVPHHDVKPSNVMMTGPGTPKVTDFGLSRAIGFAPAYCSPEQFKSAQPSGAGTQSLRSSWSSDESDTWSRKSDTWSWGLTVLSMFTGGTTWLVGYLAPQILADYLGSASRPPGTPAMPDAVADLLRQCFDADVNSRLGDMAHIARQMIEIYQHELRETYPRKQPKAPDWRASTLNNKALSDYELGSKEKAMQEWREALKVDVAHPQANYNLGLAQWRDGQIIDLDLVDICREVVRVHPEWWLPAWLLSQVHLERGDCEAAIEMLSTLDRAARDHPEAAEAYNHAKKGLSSSPKCLGTLGAFDPEKLKEILPEIIPKIISKPELPTILTGALQAQNSGSDGDKGKAARALFTELAPYAPFHVGHIWSVDMSRDWTLALSGSEDKTIKLWDINTGECLRTFNGHSDTVRCVRFGHDGSYLVSGSWDNTARVWEASSGNCLFVLEGHAKAVNDIAVSPDGKHIVSASDDGTLRLWKRETGESAGVLEGHTKGITAVCLVLDRYVVSGSRDGTIQIWDRFTGTCVAKLRGHPDGINSLCVDKRLRVLTASSDKTLSLWNFTSFLAPGESAGPVRTLKGDRNAVTSAAVTPDGRSAVAGSWDKSIRRWNLQGDNARCLRSFDGHQAGVTSVQVNPRGDTAVSASYDGTLRLWSLAPGYHYEAPFALAQPPVSEAAITGAQVYRHALTAAKQALDEGTLSIALHQLEQARGQPGYERDLDALKLWQGLYGQLRPTRLRNAWQLVTGHDMATQAMRISLDARGQTVLSGDMDHVARLWNLGDGKPGPVLYGHEEPVVSVCLSRDGRRALTGSWDRTVRLWDTATGACLRVLSGHPKQVMSVCLSADGRFALSGGWDQTVRLWNTETGRLLGTLTGHEQKVNAVCLDRRNLYALSADFSGIIRLWDLRNGDCIRTLRHGGMVHELEFTQTGFRAFSVGASKDVVEWDLILGKRMRTFEGHDSIVFTLSLGLGDRFLLTGSRDKTMRMWDTATGECLRTFGLHEGEVSSVRLSQDGRCAVSVGSDKIIRVWALDWELEYRDTADWDDGARPYLQTFLDSQGRRDLLRHWKRPRWTDEDWQELMHTLQCAGYGWLRPNGVRRQLAAMADAWKGPCTGL